MDADEALIRAYSLGMDEAGWTDEVMDKAEELLPTLIAAGYAARDDEANTWRFAKKGVARAKEIVIEGRSSRRTRESLPGPVFRNASEGGV